MKHTIATISGWAAGLSLLACGSTYGGGLFDTSWQNDRGESIARVERNLRGAPRAPNAQVVVGVTRAGLVGSALDGSNRWQHPAQVDTTPIVAGDLVLFSAQGRVHALDAKSGARVWDISSRGRKLHGAGSDGKFLAVVLSGDTPGPSTLLGVTRGGDVRLEKTADTQLGRPAVRGGVAFVPWGDQYVSAVDLESGDELGRLLMRELVSYALNAGGELFFGQDGLVRFDDKIQLGWTNQANRLSLPVRELPGKPEWLGSGYQLSPVTTSARTKIRLYATPVVEGGALEFGARAYLATYFRVAMGLDTRTNSLRFARAFEREIVGGAAAASGFLVCDAGGKVFRVGEDGGDAGQTDFGVELKSCTGDASATRLAAGTAPPKLAEQIALALDRLDADMAVAERLLVDELSKIDDPLVTKILIDLSQSSRIPPDLVAAVRRMLSKRKNGLDYMLAALEQQYDFISGVLLPPPLGPLADALSAAGETRAAPLLARHLNDPANASADVERAALALEKLATPAELQAIRTFFALYRATADEPELVRAVIAAARALVRIGAEPGREIVQRASQDLLTQADVRRALPAILQPPEAAKKDEPGARAEKSQQPRE
jgi:hypothetical protein